MDNSKFVSELAKLRTSSTFLSLIGYRSEHSEVANYNIVFHMSYKSALEKSILALEPIVPASVLEARAKDELIESFKTSLNNIETQPIEEIDDAYTRFFDSDGNYIKGVKLHTATDCLHLYGLVVHKRIIMPGVFPKKNRRELTIAKDNLRKLCPVNKFRQFKITPNHVDKISVENLSFLPPE